MKWFRDSAAISPWGAVAKNESASSASSPFANSTRRASNPSIRSFNERAAINARLQGSAADIIRRAMIRIEPQLKKDKLNAQMLLQVHDELIFEVPENEVERTIPIIKSVMQSAPDPAVALHVPLQVDARAAGNWDEAH